jgi:SAM-dependent methyltransferase
MKRVFDPNELEFIDREQPVTPAFENELRHLEEINRYFGSHRLIRKFLSAWLNPGRCYRVLDLCTSSGDIPRVMVEWARKAGITLRIDAVDANESALEIARRLSADYPEIRYIRGDARTFETDETYDFACCSLSLHHFADDDALRVLRRCRLLTNRFALVADLERSLLTSLGVRLLTTFLYREPNTRADALTSARHAFTYRELHALADAAGWLNFGHARFLCARQAIWLDGRDAGDIPLADDVALPCPT